MFLLVGMLLRFFRGLFSDKAELAENVALRQQLTVLERSVKRSKLKVSDRAFWVWLSKLWANWRLCLQIMNPDTVVRWH